MAGRRETIRAPELAGWLTSLRGSHTRETVAAELNRLGVKCGASKLGKIEKEHRLPGLDVLWGLLHVYRAPAERAFALLARDLRLGRSNRRAKEFTEQSRHAAPD